MAGQTWRRWRGARTEEGSRNMREGGGWRNWAGSVWKGEERGMKAGFKYLKGCHREGDKLSPWPEDEDGTSSNGLRLQPGRLRLDTRTSRLPRPICLPCTVGASQALKEKRRKTCREHERELLGREQVPAHFISLGGDSLSVRIKAKQLRPSCIAGAIQPGMIYANVSSVSHVVTDRFLCSGQISGGSEEASTCKGESGGALFLEKKLRNFQVGVVSWGTASPCQPGPGGTVQRKPLPKHHVPRDFYISLFAVQDWLRQVLGGAVAFVPLQ